MQYLFVLALFLFSTFCEQALSRTLSPAAKSSELIIEKSLNASATRLSTIASAVSAGIRKVQSIRWDPNVLPQLNFVLANPKHPTTDVEALKHLILDFQLNETKCVSIETSETINWGWAEPLEYTTQVLPAMIPFDWQRDVNSLLTLTQAARILWANEFHHGWDDVSVMRLSEGDQVYWIFHLQSDFWPYVQVGCRDKKVSVPPAVEIGKSKGSACKRPNVGPV